MANMKKTPKLNNQDDLSEPQFCEECGGTLRPNKIKLEEFEGGKLYVIEDVPVMECESCGEVWVPEPIIKEFESMIDTAKDHTKSGKRKTK
jgi:YgiT-type zinc finger domain-containing protein